LQVKSLGDSEVHTLADIQRNIPADYEADTEADTEAETLALCEALSLADKPGVRLRKSLALKHAVTLG
jgi:hypothetical protein